MSRLNILVLHRMGDPISYRESIYALEYMIPECRADVNCVVHDADLKFPKYLEEVEYHLIVLGPTFLCSRYNPRSLKKSCTTMTLSENLMPVKSLYLRMTMTAPVYLMIGWCVGK